MIQTLLRGNTHELLHDITVSSQNLLICDPLFDIPTNEYESVLKQIDRVSSDDATLYVFTDWKNCNRVLNLIEKTIPNWFHLNWITWSRMSPGSNGKTYKNGQEFILWFVKNKKKIYIQ